MSVTKAYDPTEAKRGDILTLRHVSTRDPGTPVVIERRLRVSLVHTDMRLVQGTEVHVFVYVEGYREKGRDIPCARTEQAFDFDEVTGVYTKD